MINGQFVGRENADEVGRFVFLETILQAFTIDGEGQRVAISSEKVGFLAADAGPGFFFLLYI
jgi:hypothetical protein